ncbi:MAG TPA: hypothetical protein DCF73_06160 [Rhodobiaceae bacterium]|nr:hypothetical protein [Rhodobiaceae bacterium]
MARRLARGYRQLSWPASRAFPLPHRERPGPPPASYRGAAARRRRQRKLSPGNAPQSADCGRSYGGGSGTCAGRRPGPLSRRRRRTGARRSRKG